MISELKERSFEDGVLDGESVGETDFSALGRPATKVVLSQGELATATGILDKLIDTEPVDAFNSNI